MRRRGRVRKQLFYGLKEMGGGEAVNWRIDFGRNCGMDE